MDIVQTIVPRRFESQRFGRSMKVVSEDRKKVVFSDDGNSLEGTWYGRAPESFRRIPESSLTPRLKS
jgi:hypothetical protein